MSAAAVIAIVLFLFFLVGVVVGVLLGFLVTISRASNREDRLGTLTRQPPDAAARGARRLYGLGLRDITPRDTRDARR